MGGYLPGGAHEIKSLEDFLINASDRFQIPFKYLWIGEIYEYFVFLIELSGGNQDVKKYLLNVKELSG